MDGEAPCIGEGAVRVGARSRLLPRNTRAHLEITHSWSIDKLNSNHSRPLDLEKFHVPTRVTLQGQISNGTSSVQRPSVLGVRTPLEIISLLSLDLDMVFRPYLQNLCGSLVQHPQKLLRETGTM